MSLKFSALLNQEWHADKIEISDLSFAGEEGTCAVSKTLVFQRGDDLNAHEVNIKRNKVYDFSLMLNEKEILNGLCFAKAYRNKIELRGNFGFKFDEEVVSYISAFFDCWEAGNQQKFRVESRYKALQCYYESSRLFSKVFPFDLSKAKTDIFLSAERFRYFEEMYTSIGIGMVGAGYHLAQSPDELNSVLQDFPSDLSFSVFISNWTKNFERISRNQYRINLIRGVRETLHGDAAPVAGMCMAYFAETVSILEKFGHKINFD